jgi:hypothetical protein
VDAEVGEDEKTASAGAGGGRCRVGNLVGPIAEDDADGIDAEVEAVSSEDLGGGLGDDGTGRRRSGRDVDGANAFEVGEPNGGGKDARELLDRVDEPELQVVSDVARAGFFVDQRSPKADVDVVPSSSAGLVLVSGPAVGRLQRGQDGGLLGRAANG